MSTPQCCGLCGHGKRLCPTPEACHIPASTPAADPVESFLKVACAVVGAASAAALLAAVVCAVLGV